jgi:hypothetical protein
VTESSSLDHSETSEKPSPIQAFLAEKPQAQAPEITPWDSLAVKFRHAGWRGIRDKIWQSMKRTGQTSSRIAAFCSCGGGSWLQRRQTPLGAWEYRICGSCCHDRLCTPCANTRSHRLQMALKQLMEGGRISFITLTLAGKDEGLAEKVDRLYKHFKALRQHPLWADNVAGGAAFLEIKWSDKAQRWHPHLHLICQTSFIDQGELSDVWRGITRDSYIVDIRRVRDDEVASRYVTKYASKPLNTSFCNTPELLDEALVALKGRRLAFTFGEWYGTPLDFDSDSLLDEDDFGAPDWENYMPLEVLMEQCNTGDQESQTMMRIAGGESRWRQSLSAGP